MISPIPTLEHEAASVAFEQAAWWRSRGLAVADAQAILGLHGRSSWMRVEYALRCRWREANQIINARRVPQNRAA